MRNTGANVGVMVEKQPTRRARHKIYRNRGFLTKFGTQALVSLLVLITRQSHFN